MVKKYEITHNDVLLEILTHVSTSVNRLANILD